MVTRFWPNGRRPGMWTIATECWDEDDIKEHTHFHWCQHWEMQTWWWKLSAYSTTVHFCNEKSEQNSLTIADHSFNSTILTEFLQLLQEVQSSIFYQNYPPKSPAQTPLRKMMCDFLLDQIYFYLEQAKWGQMLSKNPSCAICVHTHPAWVG